MAMPAQPGASSASQQQRGKMTALERNRLEWETHKNEIEEIYMDQDKTLEETMLFFKEKRGLDWSKRYWKIKLKEWKFEKNVPAKEMSFMAAKARKREFEDGKETVFYRNGVLVNASKVENKKQKLSADDLGKLMVPDTPQHMSYETPKPSFAEENDASSPNPEPQNSELEEIAAELGLEDHLRNEDQHVTSTSRENPDYAASGTKSFLDQVDVSDLTEDSEIPSGNYYIAQRRIVPEEQDAKAVDEMLMTELLSEDFALARQLRKDGQHSRAAQHYFKGFLNYIDEGGDQSSTLIVAMVAELLQCLEIIAPVDVSASACSCLDVLHRLQLKFPLTSRIHHLVSSALKRLLVAHPEVPQGVNLYPVVLALDDHGINTPLHEALHSLLALMRNQLFTKDARNEFQFRICLLAFACNLRECLKNDSWVGDLSALKTTTWKLWTLGKLLESELNAVNSWNTVITGIYRAIGDLSHDREYFVTGCYSSAEPSITELADTCSLNGWAHEAELLFTILLSAHSSEIISEFRRFQISITYCLHLERQERYEELLYSLLVLYKHLENSTGGDWAFIYIQDHASRSRDYRQVALDMRNVLNRVPDRLDSYISSERAMEITRLKRFFEAVQSGKSASEGDVNGDHAVAQEDRVEAEDNDDQMNDCTSSVKFGVTYTESVITGISFNYSGLYKYTR